MKSRLTTISTYASEKFTDELYGAMERRLASAPAGLCPVDLCLNFVRLAHAQTCGKCVPCRIGLGQAADLLREIVEGRGSLASLQLLESTARVIADSADCALGSKAAELVLQSLQNSKEDYLAHIEKDSCTAKVECSVPCRALCPAHVDVPGYIALTAAGRYSEAVALIRQDNPFPAACALICEHPCELRCRRRLIDAPINIRALKRSAVDGARGAEVPLPFKFPSTGKKVAVVGGGPGGLTCAYYLQLMGHSCTVFEAKPALGGMLRYGVPSYRLPRERLDEDIAPILATGVEVQVDTEVCGPHGPALAELRENFDAVYLAVGAHGDKKLRVPGEDAAGVFSAVALLRDMEGTEPPKLQGETVVVVGGGNVAMDCVRTCIRLGAAKTYIVYRRRRADMTALPEEVQAALAEGAELVELAAPSSIEKDEKGAVAAFIAQPQRVGPVDGAGRPKPLPADAPPLRIPCSAVIVAVGQQIPPSFLQGSDLPVKWGSIDAEADTSIPGCPGLFAGGDCVGGPGIVIDAIAAGKVAAANIDAYLGFDHRLPRTAAVPEAEAADKTPWGRAEQRLLPAHERKNTFAHAELPLSREETCQEAARCLRCDRFGRQTLEKGGEGPW